MAFADSTSSCAPFRDAGTELVAREYSGGIGVVRVVTGHANGPEPLFEFGIFVHGFRQLILNIFAFGGVPVSGSAGAYLFCEFW